jgi:hypothetical protein
LVENSSGGIGYQILTPNIGAHAQMIAAWYKSLQKFGRKFLIEPLLSTKKGGKIQGRIAG